MSDNKGLENTKYKLIKNEDKLILTDKKTLKARVLEVDDIDYVIDDNQRLRDPNVIENYFRLKDEPYEPKMMTKTADYVKEQKEAEKLYSAMKYEDLIDEFIKKYNLTTIEIEKFSQVPDETTIKKLYGRTDEEKKSMINDFKILKKKLTENKNLGTDIFTYLKSYFSNYSYNVELMDLNDKMNFETFIKDKSFYQNKEDYEKIKNENIKSLYDLLDKNINYFGGINLKYLNNLLYKYSGIAEICQDKQTYFKYDSNHLADALTDKYVDDLNLIVEKEGKGGGEKEDEEAFKKILNLYKNLDDDDKRTFDRLTSKDTYEEYNKAFDDYINLLQKNEDEKKKVISKPLADISSFFLKENVYNKYKKRKEHVEDVESKLGDKVSDDETSDDKKTKKGDSKILGYLSIHNDIIAELYRRIDSIKKMSPLDKDEKYDDITVFIGKLIIEKLKYFDSTVKLKIVMKEINDHEDKLLPYKITALFWSEKNKSSKIKLGSPKEYTSGKNENITQKNTGCDDNGVLTDFFKQVLKPILEIVMKDVNVAKGNLKSSISSNSTNNVGYGWTDKTLTRIEKITDILKEYGSGRLNTSTGRTTGVCYGWTDKTLTRIEKITNILKEYGSGRVNPALLRVMNKPFNTSSGWTDKTLTRIEKINDSLKEYI